MKTLLLTSLSKKVLVLLAVGGVMFATNPNKTAYVEYSSEELGNKLQAGICKGPELPDWLQGVGKITSTTCKSGIAAGFAAQNENLKKFIQTSTKRSNFHIMSVYTTQIPGHTLKTIGAFGNFITLPVEDNK